MSARRARELRDGSHTGRVLVGATVALLAVEAWALRRPEDRWETVSDQVWKAVDRHPMVSVAAGGVCGHWFADLKSRERFFRTGLPFLVGAAVGAIYWGRK